MSLTGSQMKAFNDALVSAFDQDSLRQMLEFGLNKRLDLLAPVNRPLDVIVFEVISKARMQNWYPDLLEAARLANPGNEELAALAQQIGLAPASKSLEKIVRSELPYIDIVKWRTKLAEIEGQVCRIRVKGLASSEFGTGFLLGPDLLMTNHHVMANVIGGQRKPEDVVLQFDYKVLADGTTVDEGTEFKLVANDWLLDSSPTEELDYALIRADGTPGETRVHPQVASSNAPSRGWIPVPDSLPTLEKDAPLFIVEHPEAAPLKLALETKSVVGPADNGTRLRHRTNTGPGSSGSPCFDANWDLVALHCGGGPGSGGTSDWNEAVPLAAILEQKNVRDLLGA